MRTIQSRAAIVDGELWFSPQEDNVAFTIPVLAALRAAIEDMPKSKRHLTFLVTEYGKPYPANGFGNWFEITAI